MKIFLMMVLLFQSLLASFACGFAEGTDYPKLNLHFSITPEENHELVYTTSHSHQVFVLVSTTPSLFANGKTDITLLVQTSQGGGYYQASGRGLNVTANKTSIVNLQIPIERVDQGIYIVKIECGI
jgi:hypothetical protein